MLVGGTGTFIGTRALFRQQNVFYYQRGLSFVPTLFPTLIAVWLFVFGLVGFIREMRASRSDLPPRD
jgi:hypothetical protein